MILTITLNPAVDKTICVDNLILGHVNRIDSSRQDAGGKGINVSKMIQVLNGESTAFGVIGGESGQYIKSEMNRMNIAFEYVELEEDTRTNIKIVDGTNKVYTDLNSQGPHINSDIKKQVNTALENLIKEDTLVVLSGSAHNGFGPEYYKHIIDYSNSKGARVILDADGDLLKHAIEAKPYLVKPNIHELEKLEGKELHRKENIIKAAHKILAHGVSYVVVSLGEDGSLCVGQDEVYEVKGMTVDVKSTVGAGDSMVAGLAVGIEANMDWEHVLNLATASATAAVMTEGSSAASPEDIDFIKKQIDVNKIG